jgi:arylsulfatase A-like enzyme
VSLRRAAALAAAAILAGGTMACESRAPRRPPSSLVLITLDTFRADNLGCSGNPLFRTPQLDRLARRGIQWSEAMSAIPLTTPSHATILTGLSPRAHGTLKNRMVLDTTRVTLAETLSASGYRCRAIVSSRVVLGPELGLSQGFEQYDVVDAPVHPASGHGREISRRASAVLRQAEPGRFLWVHFFDAHLPYYPPPPYGALFAAAADSMVSLYAGEVSFLDRCVQDIVRTVELSSSTASTSLLVTADHGEGLGEHDQYFGHDIQLYETSLRIPLLLSGGEIPSSKLNPEPARTMDVAPTILGLLGVSRPPMEGRDLLRDPPPTGDAAVLIAETHPERSKATPLYAMRTEEYKVIWEPRHNRREYYNLTLDPSERIDLAAQITPFLKILAEDLELDLRHRPAGHPRTLDEMQGGADEATREALKSLGYVD